MFTGIIEELGKVVSLKRGSQAAILAIEGNLIFEDLKLGDSVAVNGVCLTASHISGNMFQADVMNETFHRSSLGGLQKGDVVNLENDMVGKYVEKLLQVPKEQEQKTSGITMETLLRAGF